MPDFAELLEHVGEVVKIVGGIASFYAVFKLRQIEKKYLFKATVPELIEKIDSALSHLNRALSNPGQQRVQISEALNYLIVDVKNIRRKSRGDSLRLCNELLGMIQSTRSKRYFWQPETPMMPGKEALVAIYGKAHGLVRSLRHDMQDYGWSGK